ncbi:MAG: response regulator transcription factor [Saprospiraceae bacterium]|nr:response regulator transcription factor [Bacteroidia bacterium]NNE14735.1 response regulator transcription factor [Saprospiraceae bacterium]NNL93281.1 response regulator transcription factor [Saprospiraceae bacterium]
MKKKRLLLVEDEPSLRKVIKLNLEMEGYEAIVANDGKEALEKFENEYFDLAILDLMLPFVNGMDVLTRHRLKNTEMPIIIISAKDTSSDRIKGLKNGADDYLTKPFEIEELLIRIQNLLKRTQDDAVDIVEGIYTFGTNSINFKTHVGRNNAHTFDMSSKEISIIKLLIINRNQVVSRQDILKSVWGYDVFPSTRTIDNFIAALRKHFEEDPKKPQYIKSVHGVGYKFVSDNP